LRQAASRPLPRTLAAYRIVNIREFIPGEEESLREVFFTSVHRLAASHYSEAQLNAWAPLEYESSDWSRRIRALRPWAAEEAGVIVGYADLQASGYIDHFFVHGAHGKSGIGTQLMSHLHSVALHLGAPALHSDVSRNAETFFAGWGFRVERNQSVVVRGVELANSRMRKAMAANPSVKGTSRKRSAPYVER